MERDPRFNFKGIKVQGSPAQAEDVGVTRDKERETKLRTSVEGLEDDRLLRAYKEGTRCADLSLKRNETSVANARASAYFWCCCFYNCCCCFPSRWTSSLFGPLCGKKFCCKQAICCEVEFRRDRWLGLMHSFCFFWHLGWAIASFSAGAGKDMEVDIFRVKPAWNNTGRNGYGFKMEKDLEIRIDTVTGWFFLLSALFHSVWMCASLFMSNVWDWLISYIDNCFCWWYVAFRLEPITHSRLNSGVCSVAHFFSTVRARRRFLEYSLSASLMLMAIGMITGLRDYNSMLGVFMLSFTTMFMGMITEMLSRPESPDKWVGDPDSVKWSKFTWRFFAAKFRSYSWRMFPHFIGWFPYSAAWIIVLGNFFRQIDDLPSDQQDRIPWFVPWAIYGTAVVFTSFSFVQVRYQWTAPKHYWRSELIYGALSLSAKTYLGGLLYWNILLADSFDESIALEDPDGLASNSTLLSLAWHEAERVVKMVA